ncbi:degenerin mec-10-like, partial [Paramuricea clavata]
MKSAQRNYDIDDIVSKQTKLRRLVDLHILYLFQRSFTGRLYGQLHLERLGLQNWRIEKVLDAREDGTTFTATVTHLIMASIKKTNQCHASKPGPLEGLRLHLDIEGDQYIGALTKEAGVRVSIQEQGVMPFPYEEGLSVAPGMATLVGMWKEIFKRVDRFGNNSCYHHGELLGNNIYGEHQNITRYSVQ